MGGSAPRLLARRRLRLVDWALLGEVFVTLAAASLLIRLVPFRRLADRMSRAPRRVGSADVARLVWAVGAVRRRVPWKAVCFQSALCLQMMLRRRGVPALLHYGIKHGEEISAHVWLSVGGEVVMGGEAADGFTCVATFPPR